MSRDACVGYFFQKVSYKTSVVCVKHVVGSLVQPGRAMVGYGKAREHWRNQVCRHQGVSVQLVEESRAAIKTRNNRATKRTYNDKFEIFDVENR